MLVVGTLVLWTVCAVASVRRMHLSRSVLRVEASLATAVAAAMIVMTCATALWWGTIASSAPWFLEGTRAGPASVQDPNIDVTAALMLVATAIAGYGVMRVAQSWRQLRLNPA
jgi:hypothetical protein